MKYLKIILKILLTLLLITIIISFIFENIVIETFSQEILAKKISGYSLDEFIYDVDIDELGKIENDIRNSKETKEITKKFINTIIDNVVYNKNKQMDLEKEIDLLILQNISQEISEEKLNTIKEYITEQITNTEERLERNLLYSFGNDYLIILKAYNIFTNIYFRIIVISLCIVDIVVLIVLEKYKILKYAKICSSIITIFSLIILGIITLMSNFIDQKLAGGWLQSINVNSLIVAIIVETIITFLLFIIEKKKQK